MGNCCCCCCCDDSEPETKPLITRDQQDIEIGRLKHENEQLKEELSELTSRLAQEMNIKIAGDESSLENISIPCRPMKIVEDYQHFTSNTWLDAKEALDKKGVTDEVSRRLLCEILMVSRSEALQFYQELLHSIGSQLNNPLQGQGQEEKDLPKEFIPQIGDYLRRNVATEDLTPLEEKIKAQILAQSADTSVESYIEELDAYIKSAASLAWKMCLQRPPMTFDTADLGKPFQNQEEHPLAWNSEGPQEGSTICAYQYPSLMHGDKCMVKGQVYLTGPEGKQIEG